MYSEKLDPDDQVRFIPPSLSAAPLEPHTDPCKGGHHEEVNAHLAAVTHWCLCICPRGAKLHVGARPGSILPPLNGLCVYPRGAKFRVDGIWGVIRSKILYKILLGMIGNCTI